MGKMEGKVGASIAGSKSPSVLRRILRKSEGDGLEDGNRRSLDLKVRISQDIRFIPSPPQSAIESPQNVSEEILKTEDVVEEIDDIDVIDGNPKMLEKEDSLDDYDGGKFSYSQDSLRKHKRKLSIERTKPRRKVSNVVEVDEKLLVDVLEKK